MRRRTHGYRCGSERAEIKRKIPRKLFPFLVTEFFLTLYQRVCKTAWRNCGEVFPQGPTNSRRPAARAGLRGEPAYAGANDASGS